MAAKATALILAASVGSAITSVGAASSYRIWMCANIKSLSITTTGLHIEMFPFSEYKPHEPEIVQRTKSEFPYASDFRSKEGSILLAFTIPADKQSEVEGEMPILLKRILRNFTDKQLDVTVNKVDQEFVFQGFTPCELVYASDIAPFPSQPKPSNFNIYHEWVLAAVPKLKQLHAHQQQALEAIFDWFVTKDKMLGLVVLPTGSGKTGIAALTPYVLNKSRTLVITPSVEISKQIYSAFGCSAEDVSFYEQVGLINKDQRASFSVPAYPIISPVRNLQDNDRQVTPMQVIQYEMKSHDLTIANAHKFTRSSYVRINELDPFQFDLVIVDEAHHYPADTWSRIVDHFKRAKLLFLTATPTNRGAPILPSIDSHICYRGEPAALVEAGVIRPLSFREVGRAYESEDNRFSAIIQCVLDTLVEHDKQDPSVPHQGMILTRTVKEAARLTGMLGDRGQQYTADTSFRTLEDFQKGKFPILVVCGRLLEGFDHKPVSVCGIARNVRSRVLFQQFVGRCVRKVHKADHLKAVVVSHVEYKQAQMFEQLDQLASEDPLEDEEE